MILRSCFFCHYTCIHPDSLLHGIASLARRAFGSMRERFTWESINTGQRMRPLSLKSLAPDESSFLYFLSFFLPLSLPNFSGSVLWSRGSGPGHWQKGTMTTQWQQKIKSLSTLDSVENMQLWSVLLYIYNTHVYCNNFLFNQVYFYN